MTSSVTVVSADTIFLTSAKPVMRWCSYHVISDCVVSTDTVSHKNEASDTLLLM